MSTRPQNRLLKSLALLLPLFMPLSASAEYEEVIYYHNDALGSPVLATDANGDVLWQEDYTPSGSRLRHESRELSGPLAEPQDDQWDETTWFTGKQEATRLGVLNFGARWYEPELGRFLAMDPVGVSPGNIFSFNRYTYANNNPYTYYDPDGRYPEHVLERNVHRTAGIVAGSALDRQLRAASANGQGAGGAVAVGVGAVVYLGPAFVAKELGQAAFEEATGVDLSWVPSAKNLGRSVTKGVSVDDLIKNSKLGRGTKGRTKQFDRSGGLDQANKDFDALGPQNVRDIDTPFGPGRTGTLPDGRQVNVRPGSSNGGPPTLEIQQGKNRIKFRFDE